MVCPGFEAGYRRLGTDSGGQFRPGEEGRIVGHQHPGGGVFTGFARGVGGDAHGLHAGGLRQQGDRRPQVDMTIRDVKGQNAPRVQMFSIDGQRLGGEEVDWNGIARECVDNQDVEVLRGFASK